MNRNRTPRSLWAAVTTALTVAALAALGTTQALHTASANDDPAGAAARQAAPAHPTTNTKERPTLHNDSRGQAVVELQQRLTAHGHAVTPDGIVGPHTWNALLTGSSSTKPAPTKPKPAPRGYVLKLTKNWSDPLNSRLALVKDGKQLKSYRAGSGGGSTDECVPNTGWVPNGIYKIKGHFTDRGNWNPRVAVQGYAIQIEDKYCTPAPGQKPVKRTEMFIHSEMLTNGGQAPDNWFEKDDTWHWNGPSDYSSFGCIKLAPHDIKDLFTRLDQAGWPKNLTLNVS
ncbi:L,D-transpeptidase family protein [Streptomyces sp. NPDC054847]